MKQIIVSISSITPDELTQLYEKIIGSSLLSGDSYVYEGGDMEILDALSKFAQFGFGDGKSVPNYNGEYPWKDW
ncbi:MAG: hypothetical protein ACXAD7_11710 [Candidatus Kariarchaeaceae archaeon]|jgi:hypothetical protein